MSRMDRRDKLALDESYRYYRLLDQHIESPDLYRLAHCLKVVSAALSIADNGHFKLTRQLWRRIQQAMFDKMITSFPGHLVVMGVEGEHVPPKTKFPEEGYVEFYPERCRRADDVFRMEIKHLYPATIMNLGQAWFNKGASLTPEDFPAAECTDTACPMKPMILGQEVLDEESTKGREKAYGEWWDLYWQAYCTKDKNMRTSLFKTMDQLEAVWGNLYY